MAEYHRFKKGERVPTWLEVVTPEYLQERLVFGKDVLVEREDHGACVVYPMTELDEHLPVIELPDGNQEEVTLKGAPTTFLRWPKDDPRNKDITLLDGPRSVTIGASPNTREESR